MCSVFLISLFVFYTFMLHRTCCIDLPKFVFFFQARGQCLNFFWKVRECVRMCMLLLLLFQNVMITMLMHIYFSQ